MDILPYNDIPSSTPKIEEGRKYENCYNDWFIKKESAEDQIEPNSSLCEDKNILITLNSEIKIEPEDNKKLSSFETPLTFNFSNLNEQQLSTSKLKQRFLVLHGQNNQKLYGCHLCDFHTKHKVSLYRHVKLHNPNLQKMHKCNICSFKTFYKPHLNVHIKVLHNSTTDIEFYKCDKCSYKSSYRENLTRHKKNHLLPEQRDSFRCQYCNFVTFYKKSYKVHMEMVHQILNNSQTEESPLFKCYHCPFETKYRVNIVRHLKIHRKDQTEIYKCEDCDFQTIHKTNFNTHVLRHKDPGKIKIFECQHCSHKTFYKASLRNHLKLHMKKEEIETYKCDICDFTTIYERSLKLHVLYMHNGNHKAIEYFKCRFCKFQTRYRENWRRHEKGHNRPGKQDIYKCSECSFSTIQQRRYERHLLKHSSPKQLETLRESKPLIYGQNKIPTVIFKHKTLSNDSMKVSSQKITKKHSKSGDIVNINHDSSQFLAEIKKIFNCEQCSFTTVHKGSLRRHRETHLKPTERKEYKCSTCNFRSFTRATVNSHECPNRC